MKLKLAWTKTGDYFDIVATHPELAEWYVTKCIEHQTQFRNNSFREEHQSRSVDPMIQEIQKNLDNLNVIFKKLKTNEIGKPNNFFDQRQLNQLHKEWIGIDQTYPGIDTLLYKVDSHLFESYHALNRQIHVLENSFRYRLRGIDYWQQPNPFFGQSFPMGVFNVMLDYIDHGRSSWEKFINFELSPNDHELNQWKHFGPAISINLVKPYVQEYPSEFVAYCAQHNIAMTYTQVPLGNVEGLEQLATARAIMNKNLTQPDNYVILACY